MKLLKWETRKTATDFGKLGERFSELYKQHCGAKLKMNTAQHKVTLACLLEFETVQLDENQFLSLAETFRDQKEVDFNTKYTLYCKYAKNQNADKKTEFLATAWDACKQMQQALKNNWKTLTEKEEIFKHVMMYAAKPIFGTLCCHAKSWSLPQLVDLQQWSQVDDLARVLCNLAEQTVSGIDHTTYFDLWPKIDDYSLDGGNYDENINALHNCTSV